MGLLCVLQYLVMCVMRKHHERLQLALVISQCVITIYSPALHSFAVIFPAIYIYRLYLQAA